MSLTVIRDQRRRGSALAARVLFLIFASVAVGAGAGFLLVVFFGTVIEDTYPGVWYDGAWDAMWRAALGVAAGLVYVALGGVALTLCVARLTFARQLAREAETSPAEIPPRQVREESTMASPYSGLWAYGAYSLIFAAIALVIFSLATIDTARSNPAEVAVGIVAIAVTCGVVIVIIGCLALAGTLWSSQWKATSERLSSAWPQRRSVASAGSGRQRSAEKSARKREALASDTRLLKRMARRGALAAGVLAAASGVTFLAVLIARKPCRLCDTRYFNDTGETLIDIVLRFSGTIALVALFLVAVVAVIGWASSVRDAADIRRLAGSSAPKTPSSAALVAQVTGLWWGTRAGVTLVGIGWGIAPIIGAAEFAAPGSWPGWVVPVLVLCGFVGAAVLAWSEGAAVRERNVIREAWVVEDA
ncbi:hypothetical protein ACVXZ4_02235 [Lacisediminihabitans sp. FW035]